jgi:hypothetical protein
MTTVGLVGLSLNSTHNTRPKHTILAGFEGEELKAHNPLVKLDKTIQYLNQIHL